MKLDYSYDVIVVGAGPAGSMAAEAAAKKGASVLLLERRKEIGAPVRCGEGIGQHWLDELGIEINPKAVSARINGSILFGPDLKHSIRIRNPETKGYVIDRKVFDKDLALMAGRAGAEIWVKSEVVGVIKEDEKVVGVRANIIGEERRIECKVLCACDGGESVVARMAGLNSVATLYDTDFGVEYEMVNVECEDLIEIYFSRKYSPRGYVWVFPKGKDVANVGVGIGGDETPNAIHYLNKFIKENPERFGKARPVAMKGGIIPVGAPMKEIVGDGIVVAGTAAHQVDPIHGGGICLAMEAGRMAGEVAARCALEGTTNKESLMEYYDRWKEKREKKLLRRLQLRKALEKLDDEDLDAIFRHLTDDDVANLLKGDYGVVVKKVLVHRPQLLKVLSVLM